MTGKIKVLIADDEQYIRLGLMSSLDWEKLECIVDAEAEDGEQALDRAREYKPDIIITDINMPFINGLEFCRKIREEVPDTELIILTGYDEFEYARQSIQLGVREFLVKPVPENKLLEVVQKSIEHIRRNRLQKHYIETLEQQLNTFLPAMKEQFLQDLFRGQLAAEEMERKADFFNIHPQGRFMRVFIVNIDGYESFASDRNERDKQLVILGIKDIAREYMKKGDFDTGIWEGRGRLVFLFSLEKEHDTYELSMNIAQDFRDSVRDKLGVSISVGMGGICTEFGSVPQSYYEAANALNYSLILGEGSILDNNFLEKSAGSSSAGLFSREMELYNHLRMGDEAKVRELLDSIFEYFLKAGSTSIDRTKTVYMQILITSARMMDEVLDINSKALLNFSECFVQLSRFSLLGELHKFVSGILVQACRKMAESRYSKYYGIMEETRQYVEKNYKLPLTLQEIAAHVHMAPSYFSYIFKKETGENWSTFLTRVRIEKAKELLKDPWIKTYEVAFLVGFNEPNYFSNQFKKFTGYSPSDFKSLGIRTEQR